MAPEPDEKMTRHDLARAADVAAAAFSEAGWVWTHGVELDDPYVPSAADLALSMSSMMRDVAQRPGAFEAIRSGRLRVERLVDEDDERVTTWLLLELGEHAVPLPADVTPPTYDHDQDETPNQGRGVDLDRTEGDDAPGSAADAGTQSGPHEGVDGPVGQDHGGAASEPEPAQEGDGASDPPHAAPSSVAFLACPDRSSAGRQDRCGMFAAIPSCTASWCGRAGVAIRAVERPIFPQRLIDELDAIDSEAHAPDQPQASAISYRSIGRGAYDVIENRAEGPDRVLAQVLFTGGVRGWRGALERFTAHLATVSQDVQP